MLKANDFKNLKTSGYDLDWLDRILPQGGLRFYEDKVRAGDGWYTCLHIKTLPETPSPFWLMNLMGQPNTITKVDISKVDKESVLRSLEMSMRELNDQIRNARSSVEQQTATAERRNMQEFIARINQGGDVTKTLDIRMFVVADSEEELNKRVKKLRKVLASNNFECVVYLGIQKEEFQALFKNHTEQHIQPNMPAPVQVNASAIGGSFPFNHQSLIDEHGGYIGETSSRGPFIFDPFKTSGARTSFSSLVLGKSGAGKSTLLKMIADNMVGRDCLIRGYELNKDWTKWIHANNGCILDLSGNQGILNPLEPLATITDDEGMKLLQLDSYHQHRNHFFEMLQFLNPDFRPADIQRFYNIFDAFYVSLGLLPKDYQLHPNEINIVGRPSEDYPIIEDFLKFCESYMNRPDYRTATPLEKQANNDLLNVLRSMAYSNAKLFNGKTTLKNINEEEILFFDMQSIMGFDDSIKACLLFQSINIVWQQALSNGLKQKQLINKKKLNNEDVDETDVRYMLFFLDECQNILKPEYEFAINTIKKFVQEMRKFSAGVYFATQSPRELLPENSNADYARKINEIFELCANRFLLRQDASVEGTLRKALGTTFEESEFQMLTQLSRGEALVYLGGGGANYKITVKPDSQQLRDFDGGH